MKYIKRSFFLDFTFKEKQFPGFYSKVVNKISNSILFNNKNVSQTDSSENIYSVFDIPNYFSLELSKKSPELKTLTVPLYTGFFINLAKYQDLNDYMSRKLGRGRKSQLKRYKKRLDLCIAPGYKVFFGDFSKNEYDHIFDILKHITIRRFEQKGETNFELPYLEIYREMMYPLVRQKKASIFVIYDKLKPINITLNFIEDQLLLHWNSCYDIDYQMFNLGHVNMVNHLEWCFNHGIKTFDMGRGDFLHKRKYITDNYIYEQHIVYNSKNITPSLFAYYKFFMLRLKFTSIKELKKINAQILYSKYVRLKYQIFNIKKEENTAKNHVMETIVNKLPDFSNLNPIKVNQIDPALIKSVNYFLYNNKESVNDLTVFKDKTNNNVTYLAGKEKKIKLEIAI
ncbi:GNAT family N-acetyltransferase [Flavivirga aquimarina]|uniref:GNAT family N-acetyltransferase n=1 Tax=Flavivirga aquimarina TaxID=2027862 RepID=A0ABT8WDN5_9FLAO|nr:GNAT family N-acetyltransferase [Flavivirga aquimarina]MDO5971141.1 GNAT family N-acetyltransferase [Flavivirga aquimarina]